MPRPRKAVAEKRLFVIRVRCTESERNLLKKSADEGGLSLSDFLRMTTIHSTPLFRKATPERAAFIKALAELGKIGSNVNQIARALNRQQSSGTFRTPGKSIDYTLTGIDTLTHDLMKLLHHGH